MPVDDLYGPVAYSWWWTLVAGLALLVVAGWIVGVVLATRRRGAPDLPPRPPELHAGPGDQFAAVRPVYLSRVDAVERRFLAGELDPRGLHLELSAVVRDFATVRRGVDASVLTLTELRRVEGTRRLAGLIETYYRPAFAQNGAAGASTDAAIDGARRVISQW